MECRKRFRNRPNTIDKSHQTAIKPRKIADSSLFWWVLALARLYLATVQTGYIHPDEFHQSVQVMARDILGIDAQKPWEFQSILPIRSVTFSAVVSLPFVFIRYASPFFSHYLGIELLTPNVLLIAPRVFMTFLSFIADFCMYRIARMCYLRPWRCLEVFASSYIMLVYATRTFSNSVELILSALVLWRVCESMVDSTKVIKKESILKDLYHKSDTIQDKVKFVRMKSKLPPYNYVDSFILSVVLAYGTFVRPTFILYTFIPIAYWLQRGVVTKEVDFSYFHLRSLSLLPGIVVTTVICILADSFYYGSLTFTELVYWNVTSTSFTVTPINFFLYNSKESNLAQHGLHPYYLHLVVNIPILHGILGVIGLWSVSKYFANFLKNDIVRKPKVYSMATMLLCSFIIPVFALSMFPHQEPRFLLPTLLPLVLLHSDDVMVATRKSRLPKHFFFIVWHVWNIICVVLFGFLHQGGVTKSMISVYDHISQQPPHTNVHVIFSNMYSPPTFLLVRRMKILTSTEEGRKFKLYKSVFTYNVGSFTDADYLHEYSANVYRQALKNTTRGTDVVVCIPGTLSREFFEVKPKDVTLRRIQRISGHLTLENPPNLNLEGVKFNRSCGQLCHLLSRLELFSIDIIGVEFNKNITERFLSSDYHEENSEDEFEENDDGEWL